MTYIKDIAHLQTGIYAIPDRQGDAAYLQVKYFNEQGELIENLQTDLFLDKRLSRHLLLEGDVLFSAKGYKNFAAVYENSFGPCVASSSFFIIRCNDSILPEYLAWYINNPICMKKLKSEAKGSAIPSISIKSIGDLEIKIPDLQTQKILLEINKLRIREKKLHSEIVMLKDKLINTKILSSI